MGQLFLFIGLFHVVFVVVSFWDNDNKDNMGQLFLFKGVFRVVFVVVSFLNGWKLFFQQAELFLQVLDYFFLLAELNKIVQDFCAVSFPWD